MPTSPEGVWSPNLFGKQLDVLNSQARALLVCGPRKSGKTWATLHKIVRHLWDTPSARVAMFSRTLKNSKEGGTWSDLHTIVLPEWFKSRIGIRYTTKSQDGRPGPKVDGQTRTPYFKVANRYGKESELMLFSLDHDPDIEDKLKEQRFSMIYFSELSKFRDRKILSVSLPSLRMPHLAMSEQQWIADTNPSEEGDASWIYEVWYVERVIGYQQYVARQKEKGQPVMSESAFLNFQRGLQLIEIRPEENPFLDPAELEELKATYAYDQGLYERYVNGKWVYGDGDSSIHFRGSFFPNKHVIGSTEGAEEDWLVALPTQNCFEIVTGWDLGDVNHAFVALERMVLNGQSHFVVLEELESIGEEVDNTEFTKGAMELVEGLEASSGRQFGLERAWSDNSSFSFKASGGNFPYLEVYAASGNRIYLQAVPKPRDSVKARVRMLKQLLHQNRIKVSAHCKATIRMFQKLRKGQTVLDYVVRDENKHIFDALTYALLMEMAEEFEMGTPRGTVRNPLIVTIGR